MTTQRIPALAISLALASTAVGAQPVATLPDPALEALVSEALRTHADIAAVTASAEAAGFRIAPAQTLPDPFLSFTYQNDGWAFSLGQEDMTFLGMMFSQPLPWPGKLRLAGEEATLRADEIRTGTIGRATLSVEGRVRRAYFDYLNARGQIALIDERSQSWREISEIARDRYAAGIGAQQDVLRAQVEVLRLDELRADENARLANRQAELDRLLGRAQDQPIASDHRLEFRPEVPDLTALLAAARSRSPELAAYELGIEADTSRVDRTKKAFRPDFVASGGPMYRGGLEPMWQVGLGITLPIHVGSRQKPLLEEAQAELSSARSRAASAAQELELRTRERYRNLEAAIRVARLYRDGVIPTDQLALESAVASYRTGKTPFVTVLEVLNTLYADRSVYLSRLAEAEKWRAAIDEADLQPEAPMGSPPGGAAPSLAGPQGMAASTAMR